MKEPIHLDIWKLKYICGLSSVQFYGYNYNWSLEFSVLVSIVSYVIDEPWTAPIYNPERPSNKSAKTFMVATLPSVVVHNSE